MKKFITSLFLLLLCLNVFAQMETEENTDDKYLTNVPIKINPEAVNYSGSAYENDNFILGNVYKKGRIVASNVALRYNALRDEIEVKSSIDAPNSSAKVMMRNPDIYIKVLNKVFVYVAPNGDVKKPGYFQVLFEGENADLYKKISKEFIEGMAATNSLTRDVPNSYKEKEAYFLFDKKDSTFKEFPTSRNGKFSLFNDKKKKVKSYSKEERLNPNKEYALIKVVKYYDTL